MLFQALGAQTEPMAFNIICVCIEAYIGRELHDSDHKSKGHYLLSVMIGDGVKRRVFIHNSQTLQSGKRETFKNKKHVH